MLIVIIFQYSWDLKSWLVWISNGQKEVGLQRVWILNGIWNPEAQPFDIWTFGRHFVKNHLKSWQNIWISNGLVFKWLELGTVARAISKAQPFGNRTNWNPIFKMSGFQMFLDMVGFNIPSVLHNLSNYTVTLLDLERVGAQIPNNWIPNTFKIQRF